MRWGLARILFKGLPPRALEERAGALQGVPIKRKAAEGRGGGLVKGTVLKKKTGACRKGGRRKRVKTTGRGVSDIGGRVHISGGKDRCWRGQGLRETAVIKEAIATGPKSGIHNTGQECQVTIPRCPIRKVEGVKPFYEINAGDPEKTK